MPEKLKSRKFWFALLGAVLPIVAQYFSDEIMLGDAVQLSIAILVFIHHWSGIRRRKGR